MIYFCTLFDKNYLANGLALYESLIEHTKCDFKLFVLAMDNYTYQYLEKKRSDNFVIISLKDFEYSELLNVKAGRSFGEYCWTCTPSLISYCLNNFQLPFCIYLDSDIFFFNDPQIGWLEMPKEYSVLITDHNYHPKHDNRYSNGLYCVQYVGFKNNIDGKKALNWWRDSCIDWCFARVDGNRFGDQKYLDDWVVRFQGVWVSQNKGLGLAPWNVEMFEIQDESSNYIIIDKVTRQKFPIIFYHFHGFKVYADKIRTTEFKYFVNTVAMNKIYKPYILKVLEYTNTIGLKNPSFKYFFDIYKKIIIETIVECIKIFSDKSKSPFNNLINIKPNKKSND
jgi:hypothetical protein